MKGIENVLPMLLHPSHQDASYAIVHTNLLQDEEEINVSKGIDGFITKKGSQTH